MNETFVSLQAENIAAGGATGISQSSGTPLAVLSNNARLAKRDENRLKEVARQQIQNEQFAASQALEAAEATQEAGFFEALGAGISGGTNILNIFSQNQAPTGG